MKEEGLKPEIIVCEPGGPAKVREAVTAYVKKHGLPEGLFCYSDDFAFATMRALADLGHKPGIDVRVIGFDNVMEAEFATPALSSVSQPVEEMCRIGMHFLFNRIREPKLARQVSTIGMRLVTRESTLARSALLV